MLANIFTFCRALVFETFADEFEDSINTSSATNINELTSAWKACLQKSVEDYTRALDIRPGSIVTLEARCLVRHKLQMNGWALLLVTHVF